MKKGYIPRDQRKKILMLSDDIRTHSGVGCQARNIILNSAHHFNWVNLGGAVNHPENGKSFDVSENMNELTGIKDSDVKIYCSTGYGNPNLLRSIINICRYIKSLSFVRVFYSTP